MRDENRIDLREQGKQHRSHCTSTDALIRAQSSSQVALQSLGVVTRLRLAAVLEKLPCTHFAASAAVQCETDSCCTPRGVRGTAAVVGAGGRRLK